jgi:ribose transport system permease protein
MSKRSSNFQVINWIKLNWISTIPYLILLLLIIIMGMIQPNSIRLYWMGIKTDGTLALILAAVGQSFVIFSGGIDLSVGGVICITNSLAAIKMSDNIWSIILVSIAILILGAALGAFNGLLVIKVRLQPIIATLITWYIYSGIALIIIPTDEGDKIPQIFIKSLLSRKFGVPVSLIILIIIILFWIYIKRTVFGMSVFAVGSNENSAYFNGVNISKIKIYVYSLSGFFAACAGLFRTAQVASGSPTAGNNFNLLSIAAVVIGGASLKGGKGNIIGSIAGAFILKIIGDLLIFFGISSYWVSFFQGILLIIIIGIFSVSSMLKSRREIQL